MSIFDALNTAQQGIGVHRYRSEVAARNLANLSTPGYEYQTVDLAAGAFSKEMNRAGAGGRSRASIGGVEDAQAAVRVSKTRADGAGNPRIDAMRATFEMLASKSAMELNVRSATMLKSMALSALEINRT